MGHNLQPISLTSQCPHCTSQFQQHSTHKLTSLCSVLAPSNPDNRRSDRMTPFTLAAFFTILPALLFFCLANSHRTDSGINLRKISITVTDKHRQCPLGTREILFPSNHADCLWGPPSLLFSGYPRLFSEEYSGRRIRLITHPIQCRGYELVVLYIHSATCLQQCALGQLNILQ